MSSIKLHYCLLGCLFVAACSSSSGNDAPDAAMAIVPCVPSDSTAPTYTQLYTKYFAAGATPGHCANKMCHSATDTADLWQCGDSPASCFAGMTSGGSGPLVNTANPTASLIANPSASPLSWINPHGPMPFDTPGANPTGAADIKAWVANCAQNN